MHWYWVDALCIGFGLTPGKLIFKRFVSLRKNQGYSFCNVCRSTLKWTGFCPNLSPHPHVILHAGLARSCRIHCFKKRRKAVSLERRCPPGRMKGEKMIFWLVPIHMWQSLLNLSLIRIDKGVIASREEEFIEPRFVLIAISGIILEIILATNYIYDSSRWIHVNLL